MDIQRTFAIVTEINGVAVVRRRFIGSDAQMKDMCEDLADAVEILSPDVGFIRSFVCFDKMYDSSGEPEHCEPIVCRL